MLCALIGGLSMISIGQAGNKMISGIILQKTAGEVEVESRGLANDATSLGITEYTPFLIASASKTFVAVAVLTLVDRGLLSLQDPVAKYFPDATARWLHDPQGEPTIHHLLNHSSGIPDAYAEASIEKRLFQQKLDFSQLFSAIEKRPLRFAPGARFEYSNIGYIVLGEIIRRVGRSSYREYLRRTLFAPLAMPHSTVGAPLNSAEIALSYFATRHGRKEYLSYFGIKEKHVDDTFVDGNIYTCAHDLLRWVEALFSGEVLSPAALEKMLTDYGAGYGYGINISQDEESGQLVYDHDGEWIGYQALVRYTPGTKEIYIKLENLIP